MKKTNHPSGFFDLATLPFSENMLSQVDPAETALPHIQIQGFSGIHDETRNALYRTMVHTAETSTDLNRGNHNVKLGMEFRSSLTNQASFHLGQSGLPLRLRFHQRPAEHLALRPGSGFRRLPAGATLQRIHQPERQLRGPHNYYGVFLQDNWRVTPN